MGLGAEVVCHSLHYPFLLERLNRLEMGHLLPQPMIMGNGNQDRYGIMATRCRIPTMPIMAMKAKAGGWEGLYGSRSNGAKPSGASVSFAIVRYSRTRLDSYARWLDER